MAVDQIITKQTIDRAKTKHHATEDAVYSTKQIPRLAFMEMCLFLIY
jgi:hypothetical protein